jgi:hypothetical protein
MLMSCAILFPFLPFFHPAQLIILSTKKLLHQRRRRAMNKQRMNDDTAQRDSNSFGHPGMNNNQPLFSSEFIDKLSQIFFDEQQ